jgi:WD40 repeat protein
LEQLAFHPVPHPTLGSRYLLTQTAAEGRGIGKWTLWDIETETPVAFPAEFAVPNVAVWNPQGTAMAVGNSQGQVGVFAFDSSRREAPWGAVQQRLLVDGAVQALVFSADGSRLAIGSSKGARVWDIARADFITPPLAPLRAATALTFDAAGSRLAVGSQDHRARLFAVPSASADPVWGPEVSVPHSGSKTDSRGRRPPLLFLNHDRELLTYPSSGELVWVDAATGRPKDRRLRVRSWIAAAAIDKEGRHLAVSSAIASRGADATLPDRYDEDNQVQIFPAAADGEPFRRINLPHRARTFMMSMTFSPDGGTLLTGCSDGLAQLWSVPEGKPLAAPLPHPTHVNVTAFAPGAQWIATAQRGGLVRVWKTPRPGLELTSFTHDTSGSFARLSPDGKYGLVSGMTFVSCALRDPRVFAIETGQPGGPPLTGAGIVLDALFSPNGVEVVTARSSAAQPSERGRAPIPAGAVEFWDWRSGRPSRAAIPVAAEPRSLCFSPTRPHLLAVLCADGQVLVVDPDTGVRNRRQAHKPRASAGAILNNGMVCFSPDGQSLLTWGTDSRLRIWDVESLSPRDELAVDDKELITGVQFSPDGRFVAATARDSLVRIWAWNQGRPRAAPPLAVLPHPDWPHMAMFSPDGKFMLTGCRDKQARLWDWQAAKLVWSVAHNHEVHAVAFTPNGDRVLTACDDRTLRVWDAAAGAPLTPQLPLSGEGGSVAVTPDGRFAAVGGFGKTVNVFRLEGLAADPSINVDKLCQWGEVLSSQSVHSGGGGTVLTADQWLAAWREFRQRYTER